MIRRGLAVLALLAVLGMPVRAEDWRDTLTAPTPGKFAPPRPLAAIYKFGWSGLTAAEATFQVSFAPDGKRKLAMQTKTTGAVRALWRMDSRHTAVAQTAGLRPISVRQTEIYKSETQTVKLDFFRDRVERAMENSTLPDAPPTRKTFPCPNAFDLHTALLFVRSQTLAPGDVYRLLVFPSTSLYLAEIGVLNRERLTVHGQEYPAVKCEVKLQSVNRKLVLGPHQKFKRAFAWLSDDSDRLLLKIEAEIFVGSVWAELDSVKFTGS